MRKSKKIVLVLLALMLVGCTPIIPEENNNNNIIIEEPVEPIKLATNQDDLSNLMENCIVGEVNYNIFPYNNNNILISYNVGDLYSCDFSNELDSYYTCAYVDKSCEEILIKHNNGYMLYFAPLLGYNQYYSTYIYRSDFDLNFPSKYPLTWYEISKDVEVPKEIDDKILIMIYVSKDLVFTDLKNPNNESIIIKSYAEDVKVYDEDSVIDNFMFERSQIWYNDWLEYSPYIFSSIPYPSNSYRTGQVNTANSNIISWTYLTQEMSSRPTTITEDGNVYYELQFILNDYGKLEFYLSALLNTANINQSEFIEEIMKLDYKVETKEHKSGFIIYKYRFLLSELLQTLDKFTK